MWYNMLEINIQLFGGRGASSNQNSRMNFTLKKGITIGNIKVPAGTKITNVIEIAGGKRKRKIDEINELVEKYGGSPEKWSKRRATITLNGKKREIHYYQNDKIGKVKFKFKEVKK